MACGVIVEEPAIGWDAFQALVKAPAFLVRRFELPERGVGDALGIVMHGRRNEIKVRVVRQRLVDDLLPAAEAHHHVRFHRDNSLRELIVNFGRSLTLRTSLLSRRHILSAVSMRSWYRPMNMQVNIIR